MTTTSDAPIESPADAPVLPTAHPANRLCAVTVEYERRPDRRTIRPRATTREALTTTWLTADAAAFYDLAEVR